MLSPRRWASAVAVVDPSVRRIPSIRSRVGWVSFPPDDTAWDMGDRAIRCFLWLNGEKMKGSYRNAGTRKLKIHYAN